MVLFWSIWKPPYVLTAVLGGGYFWSLIDNQKRTWHDILVGTVVVRRRVRLQ